MTLLEKILGTESRSAENPANSVLDWDTGNSTESGLSMNAGRALEYAPVWQAVSMISGDLAGLPLEVLKRDPDDGRVADKQHAAYRLLARQANDETTAYWFWRLMMTHLLIWNRAYAWIIRDQNAAPRELVPLLPDRTYPERPSGVLQYKTEVAGGQVTIPAVNVLHFKGISTDGIDGCELVTKARNSWALGLAAEKFGSKFFKNGARVSGVLQYPGRLNETAAANLQNSFNAKYAGSDNVAKVVLLEENAKFIQTTIAPDEAQFTDTRTEQVRDAARWYNIDPSLLGVSGSVSYNSKEEANRAYWQSGLMPWSNTIRWECWSKLLSEAEKRSDSHIIEHNTLALLAGDVKTQAEIEEIYHRLGTRTANQIARSHNLPPVTGTHGDDYFVTQNVQPADMPVAVPTAAREVPRALEAADVAEAGRDILKESLQRFMGRVAEQACQKSKHPGKFVGWLDAFDGSAHAYILEVPTRAASAASGKTIDHEELVKRVTVDIRSELNRVIDSVSNDELAEAVNAAMTKLAATIPIEYSDELFTTGATI